MKILQIVILLPIKRAEAESDCDIDSAHDIADPNELPAEQSDSIKTPFDAIWNIYSDDLLDIITTQANITIPANTRG